MPCILLVFNCKAICNLIKVICTRQFQPYSHTHTYMYVQCACEQAVLLSCKCLSYVWYFIILHGWQFDLEASIYLHFIFAYTRNSLFERWWCRHDKFFISWALDNINKNSWQKQIRRRKKKTTKWNDFFRWAYRNEQL